MSITKKKRKRPKDSSLKSEYNSKIRQEYLDYDYLNKLSKEEYEWLAAFTHEYNCANLKHDYDKVFKRNKLARKEHNDRNNSRNRDTYSQIRAQNRMIYLQGGAPEFLDNVNEPDALNPEDSMIELIDNKNNSFKLDKLQMEFKRAENTAIRNKQKSQKRQRR